MAAERAASSARPEAMREDRDELAGDLFRRLVTTGLVPARRPVERASQRESQHLGILRCQRSVGDAIADQSTHGRVDLALERAELRPAFGRQRFASAASSRSSLAKPCRTT